MNHKIIGSQAEAQCLKYLQAAGLTLIRSNFYSRFGEIDLIMQDKKDIVFVEVKMRFASYQAAAFSVNVHKQKNMLLTAKYFILKHYKQEPSCRFDAVLLVKLNNQITWVKNVLVLGW